MQKRGKNLIAAISTLTGTIIGAGFLGIPYVVAKSGFFIGLIHIIVIGFIIMLINLYLGEIALRTKENHQIPGYAEKYLGKKGKIIMFFATIFGVYSALLAYLIAEGQSLSFIISGTNNYSFIFSIIFFCIMSLLAYKGLETLKKGESIGLIAISVIIILVLIFFIPKINLDNLTYLNKDLTTAFLPYGVVLFSFLAFSSLPELERELKGNEKLMKKAIIMGSLIPIVIYSLFSLVVVGFAGKNTPEIATIALGKLPSLLAVFTMFTAFLALSIALQDMYKFDLKLKKLSAWLLACFVPLILFLIAAKYNLISFIKILEIGGVVSGGISGIAILLMLMKAKKIGNRKPEYNMKINWLIASMLALLFLFGIAYAFLF